MTVGIESLDHTVHVTHAWISELDERLGWDNRRRSYRLLRAVLHALRDWLQVNEAVDLGAQLPTLLRGIYYEQWRPSETPTKPRRLADFLGRIENEFKRDPLIVPEEAVGIAFGFLSSKISAGEIADVRHALPADIRALWPDTATTREAAR
jgi:uncharacterized protein (DUF2267 family)